MYTGFMIRTSVTYPVTLCSACVWRLSPHVLLKDLVMACHGAGCTQAEDVLQTVFPVDFNSSSVDVASAYLVPSLLDPAGA